MTTAVATTQDPREAALLKAIGFDKLVPEQRELALAIAKRYDLDPMLKHLVIIDGKPFITRDGLLWVAHRSGQLDGIEVTKPVLIDSFWECEASVYRKDMSRPFTFPGRFPKAGRNQAYAPEMAIKCAESMALRRAFNVAAPVVEERFDLPEAVAEAVSRSAAQPSLAERAASRRAEVEQAPLVDRRASTDQLEPEAAGGPSAEPTAEPSAPRLTKPQFVGKLTDSGIDPNHAATLRLVMFPDATADLTDEQRGELWAQLEAEKAEAEAVPA